MARRVSHDPESDDPRPEDVEALGDVTRPCPRCGATLYDDVDLCWKCGHALGGADEPRRPPLWVIAVALVILGVILYPLLARVL